MTLHNRQSTIEKLIAHLDNFWLPDESIYYICKAEKQTLSERVHQYYSHKIGKKSPHKGGYWLKLLEHIDKFYVHIIPCNNSNKIEGFMLQYFIDNVSSKTRENMYDMDLPLPFANLQLRSRVIKNHCLEKHYQ